MIMFNIGDKIVYPMHGAGTIESVEEREVLGEKKKYYIMRIPVDDMKVMIPIDSMDDFGIRRITDSGALQGAIGALRSESVGEPNEWNKRYRYNLEKMRKGSICDVCEVVKSLALRDSEKPLSPGERKILESAKRILFSELMLMTGKGYDDVEEMINEAIFELHKD